MFVCLNWNRVILMFSMLLFCLIFMVWLVLVGCLVLGNWNRWSNWKLFLVFWLVMIIMIWIIWIVVVLFLLICLMFLLRLLLILVLFCWLVLCDGLLSWMFGLRLGIGSVLLMFCSLVLMCMVRNLVFLVLVGLVWLLFGVVVLVLVCRCFIMVIIVSWNWNRNLVCVFLVLMNCLVRLILFVWWCCWECRFGSWLVCVNWVWWNFWWFWLMLFVVRWLMRLCWLLFCGRSVFLVLVWMFMRRNCWLNCCCLFWIMWWFCCILVWLFMRFVGLWLSGCCRILRWFCVVSGCWIWLIYRCGDVVECVLFFVRLSVLVWLVLVFLVCGILRCCWVLLGLVWLVLVWFSGSFWWRLRCLVLLLGIVWCSRWCDLGLCVWLGLGRWWSWLLSWGLLGIVVSWCSVCFSWNLVVCFGIGIVLGGLGCYRVCFRYCWWVGGCWFFVVGWKVCCWWRNIVCLVGLGWGCRRFLGWFGDLLVLVRIVVLGWVGWDCYWLLCLMWCVGWIIGGCLVYFIGWWWRILWLLGCWEFIGWWYRSRWNLGRIGICFGLCIGVGFVCLVFVGGGWVVVWWIVLVLLGWSGRWLIGWLLLGLFVVWWWFRWCFRWVWWVGIVKDLWWFCNDRMLLVCGWSWVWLLFIFVFFICCFLW